MLQIMKLNTKKVMINILKHLQEAPSSQNSCKSYNLHDLSPRPTCPPRRDTYSQSSCKMISSYITTSTTIINQQTENNFECKDQDQAEKADCKLTKNKNMLKPPLPISKSSIRKKINQSEKAK